MVAACPGLVLSLALAAAGPLPPAPVPADSAKAPVRVVRRFPLVEVWADARDPRSSQTVRSLPGAAVRALPVDDFAEALALQPGVVAQGEELHVRGGRAGETTRFLDGIGLNEPGRLKAMEPPLLGLRGADLVSGPAEAQYGCGLAGALDLRTVDPGPRTALAWRWQTALEDRWYDRVAARLSTPLRVLGLGAVAAGDVTLDDTWLPALRSGRRQKVAGLSYDWRADNRLLGLLKLAPVDRPQRFSVQALANRRLRRPYDPAWSRTTWVQPQEAPAYLAYNAADHLAVTDERQVAVVASVSRLRASDRATLSLGWLRSRETTSLSGDRDRNLGSPPVYDTDRFHVVSGDYPLYREVDGDVLTLRGDVETMDRDGDRIRVGAGVTYEDVALFEVDNGLSATYVDSHGGSILPLVDPLRQYHAFAPGAYGYAQGRWEVLGMVLNAGLRGEYFTAGPEAAHQTLSWDGHGSFSLSPRLGFAFPVSVRDALSLSYARIHQAPGRDFLYDHRQSISNRQPLGNPALRPATVVSYEAAVKHLLDAGWALQASTFYRDVYGQVGVRNFSPPGLPNELRYVDEDDGHAGGFECGLTHAGERRRLEVHYTFMQAWGMESRPEGDPYGSVLAERVVPIGTTPLSWDRRHALQLSAAWPWRDDWTFSWSTSVGSPLPWTPKPRRRMVTDLADVNSRRLGWTENTNVNVLWKPSFAHGLQLGVEARNLFDFRGERGVSVDGYPNPYINTEFDDYAAYREETGEAGGAYWVTTGETTGHWVPVHDPRLMNPPRALRLTLGADW